MIQHGVEKEVRTSWRMSVLLAFLIFSFSHVFISQAVAQTSVEASIDSIEMFIGEQVHVTVKATMKESAKSEFPVFKPMQMITPGVEVLSSTEVGTKDANDGFVERSVVYTLTSFDDTLYYLPPFVVKIDGKAYESKSLALKVLNIEVDTTHVNQFFGPKDVQDNPFQWSEWSLPFWLSVLMLVFSVIGYYLYLRMRDNKPIISTIRIVRKLLPHQKAMKEIEQIKADNMVTSENQKEYYTKLTDTLRKYIEERYGFRAMEMTSSEIIERLMSTGDQQSLDELRQLFTTADLVKFAKYSTLINENDANLVSAIEFINQTKIENMPTEEVVKPELTEEQVRSKKMRTALKWTIVGITVVCVVILVYVVWHVWQLIG